VKNIKKGGQHLSTASKECLRERTDMSIKVVVSREGTHRDPRPPSGRSRILMGALFMTMAYRRGDLSAVMEAISLWQRILSN
jgi:hypothetical protein